MKKRIPVSGYGNIQRDVMKMDINIYSKAVYCLLMTYKGDKNACYPSMRTISDDLKISRSTVIRSISELEENKLLFVRRGKKSNGDNEVNTYIPDVLYEDVEVDGGGSPQTLGGPPQTPPLVSDVDHKNNIIKNNIEETLITNEESDDSSENPQQDLFGTTEPKSKKEKRKKKEKTAHPAYTPIVKFFCEEYWPDYKFFGARDGKQVNEIISQIERMLNNHDQDSSPEKVVDFFKALILKAPTFYQKKGLPMINSKLSEIVEEIKKQRNGQSTSKTRNEYLYADF